MGTDIHAVIQAKKDGKWVDVPSTWEQSRHYMLFAWLGDVRNGFGFGSTPTHAMIQPLSSSRGLPEDFEILTEGEDEDGNEYTEESPYHMLSSAECLAKFWQEYYKIVNKEPCLAKWMGSHSYSWVTSQEILGTELPRVLKTGVIELEQFNKWDGVSEPDTWCGGISGMNVHVAHSPSEVTPLTTHVQVEWFKEMHEELSYFIDEIKRLVELHGDLRVVFGFDS